MYNAAVAGGDVLSRLAIIEEIIDRFRAHRDAGHPEYQFLGKLNEMRDREVGAAATPEAPTESAAPPAETVAADAVAQAAEPETAAAKAPARKR